jgi:hypothetical protein
MLSHSERLTTLALLLLFVPAQAQKQLRPSPEAQEGGEVWIHNGFYNGHAFRQLSERERRAYAAGIVDGMFLAPMLGAPTGARPGISPFELPPTTRSQWLARCVVGMNDEQVAAIITSALIESCPGMPKLR